MQRRVRRRRDAAPSCSHDEIAHALRKQLRGGVAQLLPCRARDARKQGWADRACQLMARRAGPIAWAWAAEEVV